MGVVFMMLIFNYNSFSQVPPTGKYNTTNYPEDRAAIAILQKAESSVQHLNDDYIAIGPEGKVSYGVEQWKKGFTDKGASFKSVKQREGTTVLRIYNGNAAVQTSTMDVVFNTPKGDMNITVIRTETYIKQYGNWYFVSGQGTRMMSKEEVEETMKKGMEKKD